MTPFKPLKRNRKVFTCLNCKKKKTRCDRNKPCSTCIKCNKADSCQYEVEDASAEKARIRTNIIRQIHNLKLQLAEHGSDDIDVDTLLSEGQESSSKNQSSIDSSGTNDKINFSKAFGTVHYRDPNNKLGFGPPSWYSMLKHDSFVNQVRGDLIELLPSTAYTKPNATTTSILYEEGGIKEQKFRKLLLSRERLDEPLSENKSIKNLEPSLKTSSYRTENYVQTNLVDTNLVNEISTVLPPSSYIWSFLDFFFAYVHPCIPYLDETSYRDSIVQILGPPSDSTILQLKITTKLDLAPIGTLLVILRLTFLFTFSNNKWTEIQYSDNEELLSQQDKQTKFVHENHIGEEFVRLAKCCLNQFDMEKRINLSILQCLNFVEFYNVASPESGNGIDGCNLHSATSKFTRAIYLMGLNREPSNINDYSDNSVQQSIGRKLWFKLMRDDLEHCLSYGRPPFVDIKYSDVKPIGFVGKDFVNDFDCTVADFDAWFQNHSFLFSKVVEIMFDTGKQFTKLEIENRLGSIETALTDLNTSRCIQMGTADLLNGKFVRQQAVHESKFSILMLRINISVYALLMFDSEKKNEWLLAFNYTKKCLIISNEKIIPLIIDAFIGLTSDYGIFVNQYVITALHTVGQIYYGLLLRILSALNPVRKQKNIDLLRELAVLSRQIGSRTVEIMDQFSERYFHAWRIVKLFRWYRRVVSEKTHLKDFEDHSNFFGALNGAQLHDLINIMNSTLSTLDSFMIKLDVVANSNMVSDGGTSSVFNDFDLENDNLDAWMGILLDGNFPN